MGSTQHDSQHNPDGEQSRHLDHVSEVPAPPSLLPTVLYRLGLDGSLPSSLPISTLLAGLNAPEWYWRAWVLQMLAQRGQDVPLEPLLRALQDEHGTVRIAAIQALSAQGSRIPVDQLLATLYDPEWSVREAGVFALERLGEHAPIAPLLNALHDQDATVREAARSVLQHTHPHLASVTLPVSEVHPEPENVAEPALPELHGAGATKQQYTIKHFFRSLLPTGKRTIQYRGTNMQNIAFDDHQTERSFAKRQSHSSRFHGIGRNVAIGFAVIVVLANIVAWTVIAQKLRPSYPTQTGRNPNVTTHPVVPTHTPTPRPISKNIGKTLYSYQCQMDYIHGLVWFPNNKRIASSCLNVQAWDATSGKHVFTYEGSSSASVMSIIVSPDGKRIAASSQNVQVWDVAYGTLLTTYQPAMAGTQANPKAIMSGGNMIYDSAWSPDGTMIASSIDGNGYGYNVQVWNASTGKHLFTLQSKPVTSASDYISQVVWSPDGKRIAFTIDQTVQVWSVATKHLLFTYPASSFAWSPDGKYIASTNVDGTVQVWDAKTRQTIYVYKGQAKEQGGVNILAWSPDSTRIASGAKDIYIWDATTGKDVFIYKGHGNGQYTSVNIIKWSPDGTMIASAAINGMNGGAAKVWIAD